MGNRALKFMVVLLCAINSATWGMYTESRFMAILWAAVAIGFILWIIDDIQRQ